MKIVDVYDEKAKKTYVYEVTSYYDKEKKGSRKKRKILGHRDPITGEILPNRPKRKPGENKNEDNKNTQLLTEMKSLERKHYGAGYYLLQVAKSVGLVGDLETLFPKSYQALLNLAFYLVLAPTNSMKQYEEWVKANYVPYDISLTSQRISEIFTVVTEAKKQSFFNLRAARVQKEEYWYYDTTSISSYSETLPYIQYGHNKEDDKLPQLNLGVLYGEKTKLPVLYRYLHGNIPDSKTIPWMISLIDFLPQNLVKLVMDRGFFSESNVLELIENQIGFIMAARKSPNYIKEGIRSVKSEIEDFSNYSPAYGLWGKRVATNHFKPKSGKGSYPVQMYIYLNTDRQSEELQALNSHLKSLYEELESGNTKPTNEKDYRKYFTTEEVDGKVIHHLNREIVEKEREYMGYFVLLSTYKKDVWEILNIYRTKDTIEDAFHNLKDRANMRRLRVSSERSLEGKIFVEFLALILCSYIKNKLEESKLNEKYSQDKFLSSLNRIDLLHHKKYGSTISEITVEQASLYTKTGVRPPI